MWTPRELTCDICSATIDHEQPYPIVAVPLSAEDRQRIAEDIKRQISMPQMLHLIGYEQMIPKVWKLEICTDCLDRALPELFHIKTLQLTQAIEKRQALVKKQQIAAAVDDDDD